MKIVLVTDGWAPQVHGVARTLASTVQELRRLNHDVVVVEPSQFNHIPFPFMGDVPLCYGIRASKVRSYIKPPCAIHIATECTLGLAFNWYCRWNKIPFTTSFTTNSPDYIEKDLWIPNWIPYLYLKWFHNAAEAIMVSTPTLEKKLVGKGFKRIKRWSRGVDTKLFYPREKTEREKPICLFVGRIFMEKNIEAFLNLDMEIDKVVVGDGPSLKYLRKKYKKAQFLGALHGEDLARVYANSDCFVFPSKTDTFGLVNIEALASGVPIAAYPIEGPIDIWNKSLETGYLNDTLEVAVSHALQYGNPNACRELALNYTWEHCTQQFLDNLTLYER